MLQYAQRGQDAHSCHMERSTDINIDTILGQSGFSPLASDGYSMEVHKGYMEGERALTADECVCVCVCDSLYRPLLDYHLFGGI